MARRRPPVTSFYNPNNRPRTNYGSAGGKRPPAWAAGTGWGTPKTGGYAPYDPNYGPGPSIGSIGGQTGIIFDFPGAAEDLPQVGGGGGGRNPYLDIAGYTPDYKFNIEGDPEYLAALADLNAADVAQQAATQEGIKQLAIGYGGDLSQLLSQGLIDQSTANLASQNEFSTMKELGRELTRGTARGNAALASRGTLDSGALQVLRGQLQEGYQRQSTAAANDVLNQVKAAQLGLAQGKAERRSGLLGVRSGIANRLMQQAMSQARPSMRARWNPDLNAYEAPNGNLYDPNGQLLQGY